MLFVLDIGNTNMVLGVFEDNTLKYEWRIKTDPRKTEDEFAMLIKSLFDWKGITFDDIDGIIISSVVPPIMTSLEKMCLSYFDIEPVIISKEISLAHLKVNYSNPGEIGADRIVNAVAAIEEYGAPLIIIDFGTATTYCFINEDKEYCGGIITPGMNISMEALYRYASKLPKVEIEDPHQVVGTSTVEAMQSGVYYGTIGMVDGLVNQIKAEQNVSPKVIATGGLSTLIAKDSTTIDIVDTQLTLKGLNYIYRSLSGSSRSTE